jgi:hypothetical protein
LGETVEHLLSNKEEALFDSSNRACELVAIVEGLAIAASYFTVT